MDGYRKKVVHVNRIQPRTIVSFPAIMSNDPIKAMNVPWISPQIEHFVDCEIETDPPARRNPLCQCRPPDYYRPEAHGRA